MNRMVFLSILVSALATFAMPSHAVMLGVTNDAGGLVSIDLATGAAALIGPLPGTMTETVYDATNDRLYAQGSNGSFLFYEIDPADGSQISVIGTTGAYNGMEFVGGVLYATMITSGGGPSDLVTVDTATGDATVIGSTGFGPITGLAYDTANDTMYGSLGGGNADSGSLVTIDLGTGVATMVGPTGFNKVGSIEYGDDGALYGGLTLSDGAQPGALISIDPATGVGSVVGSTGYSLSGLAETVLFVPAPPAPPAAPVAPPEPVPTLTQWTLIMLAVLMALLGYTALRRRALL